LKGQNRVRFLSAPEAKCGRFYPIGAQSARNVKSGLTVSQSVNCKESLEARVGIEPTRKGFADLSLTTWVPRPCQSARSPRRKKSSWGKPHGLVNEELERETGVEPATSTLARSRSTTELLPLNQTIINEPVTRRQSEFAFPPLAPPGQRCAHCGSSSGFTISPSRMWMIRSPYSAACGLCVIIRTVWPIS
jgi:hypothetical protein